MALNFQTDCQTAISVSLMQQRPLLIFIDAGEGEGWFGPRFSGPKASLFAQSAILLKISHGGLDFTNLAQFAPQARDLKAEGVVVLMKGAVLALIQQEATKDQVEAVISGLGNNNISPSTAQHVNNNGNVTNSALEHPRSELPEAEKTKSDNQKHPETSQPAKNPQPEHAKSQKLPIATPAIVKKKTVISKLIENEKKKGSIPQPKAKPKPSVCTIQLKLLDGSTIRHQFKPKDKLHQVRSFLLQSIPEYNNYQFYFFKPVDRVTLVDGDELKSIEELALNMSTLIVRLVDPQEFNNSTIPNTPSGGPLQWMKSTWDSFWPRQASEGLNPSAAASSTAPNMNGNPDSAERIMEEADVSDTESFVSARAHPPSLRSNVSSFSLYGQGLLSTTPSSQNLRTLSQTQQGSQQQQLPLQQGQQQQHQQQQHQQQLQQQQQVQQPGQTQGSSLLNKKADEDDISNGNSVMQRYSP